MPVTHRRFGTVAVVVSTAVLTAALTAGGPAIAASVVDFAKNAGAVDGKSAVAANATPNQRKGKLVATGGTTGQLPNNIIAQAPDSAKVGGVPLSGLAPALLHATGFPIIGSKGTKSCRTPVFVTSTASVATAEGDLNVESAPSTVPRVADPSTGTTAVQMTIEVSLDGGATWKNADGDWENVVSASSDEPFEGISHVATLAIAAHARVEFAVGLTSETAQAPLDIECSVAATVLHRTPGTVLAINAPPPLTKAVRSGSRFGQAR